jgi:hypothetical protein
MNGNTSLGLGTNVKIPAHSSLEITQCTLRGVECVLEGNPQCIGVESTEAILEDIGIPPPGYNGISGSVVQRCFEAENASATSGRSKARKHVEFAVSDGNVQLQKSGQSGMGVH